MDAALRHEMHTLDGNCDPVSILVLVDAALRQCCVCVGISHGAMVSILVLVDAALRHPYPVQVFFCYGVSILVLVDAALRQRF